VFLFLSTDDFWRDYRRFLAGRKGNELPIPADAKPSDRLQWPSADGTPRALPPRVRNPADVRLLGDFRGKILRSLAGGDSPRSVSYFCSESGVIRPLAEFDQYKLLEP
jgi:hypothetical protein